MKLHSKEFYEIMSDFEKNIKHYPVSVGSQGIKREEKENWKMQHYYCDGNLNNAFRLFLCGVVLGKIL